MDERRTADLHKFLARIWEGSVSLEGIVFLFAATSGLISLSLSSITCLSLATILARNLLNATTSAQDLTHSQRISHIVRHLEADKHDLRDFLVQSKASHLTLKQQPSHSRADSTRWLNSLIAKLWPMGEIEAAEMLDHLGLTRKGQGFQVGGFKVFVDRFTLGRRPPVISRISVGDTKQTKRDEVMIDINLAYYGNCLCSFNHPIAKITDFKVGLKDITFCGDTRIALRPLLDDLPLVGGVVFCFLSTPLIDFEGVSLLNLIDNRLVKNALETIVTGLMVRPNKLYITLTKKERQKRRVILPDLLGICYVHLIRARSLKTRRRTLANKESVDPVVLMRIAETFFQTLTVRDDPNPTWFFTRSAPFSDLLESVSVRVYDRNTRDKNDVVGEVNLPMQPFFEKDELNGSQTWALISTEPQSSIQMRVACPPVKRDRQTLSETLPLSSKLPNNFPVAVVSVFIHNLRSYPGIDAKAKKALFLQIRHGHQSHTCSPFPPNENDFPRKVNDGCHFLLTTDPVKELMHILAVDGHKASQSVDAVYRPNQIVGSRTLDLKGIRDSEDMQRELSFNLYQGERAVVKVSMYVSIAAVAVTPALIHNLSSKTDVIWKL